jgi:hypothetical protein
MHIPYYELYMRCKCLSSPLRINFPPAFKIPWCGTGPMVAFSLRLNRMEGGESLAQTVNPLNFDSVRSDKAI